MRVFRRHLEIVSRLDGQCQLVLTDGHSRIILFMGTEDQAFAFAKNLLQTDPVWTSGPCKYDANDTMHRALLTAAEFPPEPEFVPPTTGEEWVKFYKVHPSIVKDYLTNKDGSIRIPSSSEWNEDFGLGYADRLAWERERGEYTT